MRIIAREGCMTKRIPENKSECTPRVRDNLNAKFAHNAGYAGGKTLRKRMARLAARKRGQEEIIAEMRRRTKSLPESAYKIPGGMK